MSTTIQVRPHKINEGEQVAELWFENHLLGVVYGSPDGPGIRITTKHLDLAEVSVKPLQIEPNGIVMFEIPFLNPHRS